MSTHYVCDICGEAYQDGSLLGPRSYTYTVNAGGYRKMINVCSPTCLIVVGQRERDEQRRRPTARNLLNALREAGVIGMWADRTEAEALAAVGRKP